MARIAIGSYEGFIHGWDLAGINWDDPDFSDVQLSYALHAHEGSVKCLSITQTGAKQGRILVTGGNDELIRIYDLSKKVELGELQQHSGTISTLEFFGSSHLLSSGDDKSIVIWSTHDWAPLHVLGGHKRAPSAVGCHPSGRLALSCSEGDRTLRLWDLAQGRAAFVSRAPGEPSHLRWSPSGARYAYALRALRGSAAGGGRANLAAAEGQATFRVRLLPATAAGGGEGGGGAALGEAPYEAGHVEGLEFVTEGLLAVAHTDPGNRGRSRVQLVEFPGAGRPAEVAAELELGDGDEEEEGEGGGGGERRGAARVRALRYAPLPRPAPESGSDAEGGGGEEGGGARYAGLLAAATSGGGVRVWRLELAVGAAAGPDGAGAAPPKLVGVEPLWGTEVRGGPRFICMDLWVEGGVRPPDGRAAAGDAAASGARKAAAPGASAGSAAAEAAPGPKKRKRKNKKKEKGRSDAAAVDQEQTQIDVQQASVGEVTRAKQLPLDTGDLMKESSTIMKKKVSHAIDVSGANKAAVDDQSNTGNHSSSDEKSSSDIEDYAEMKKKIDKQKRKESGSQKHAKKRYSAAKTKKQKKPAKNKK